MYISKGEIISNADPRHPNQPKSKSKAQFGWLGRPMASLSGLTKCKTEKSITDCSTYPRQVMKSSFHTERIDHFDDNNIIDVLARAFSVENRYFEVPYMNSTATTKVRVPFVLVILLGLFYVIFGQRALIFAAVLILFYAISSSNQKQQQQAKNG